MLRQSSLEEDPREVRPQSTHEQSDDHRSETFSHLAHQDEGTTVNYITFNQDASCIALGLSNGFRIFNCQSGASSQDDSQDAAPGRCFQHRKDESIGLVEMLYCTSLLAVVGQGNEPGSSPRKLRIINMKRNSTICDLTFPSTILKVKLTKARMIVVLEEQIYIYDITTMKLLHTIETSPNIHGLVTVSIDDQGPCYLAYPSPPKSITHDSLLATGINTNGGSNLVHNNIQSVSNTPNRVGDVIIFNVMTLQPISVVEAHKSTLAAICLSNDGALLATASDKGTIVRVFSVETGVKLFQFRRGTYPTKIYSLSFDCENSYVVATSSSGTVHIFRLGEDEALVNKQRRNSNKKMKLNATDRNTIREVAEDQMDEALINGGNKATWLTTGKRPQQPMLLLLLLLLVVPRKGATTTATTNTTSVGTAYDDNNDDDADLDIRDDGDDSDAEVADDGEDYDSASLDVFQSKTRKFSQGSTNSILSNNSGMSNDEVQTSDRDKIEPIVDLTRISMARLIRKSSQTLGRKAAQKMGDFLPSRFLLILEPTRNFASLKINTIGKDVKSIAVIGNDIKEDLVPKAYLTSRQAAASAASSVHAASGAHSLSQPSSSTRPLSEEDKEMLRLRLIHIQVVTSEGLYYMYGLDPERGGDCILLRQYLLLNEG
jgi:autophagy-related protein 18